MKLCVDPRAKALIFDLDGTLANSMPLHYKAWIKTAERNKFPFSKEILIETTGASTYTIVGILNERFGLGLDQDEITRQKEYAFYDMIDQMPANKVVVDLVHEYYGKLPMATGTGAIRDLAERQLAALGIDKKLPILVSSDDVENHKPAPDTFLQCAELLNIAPKDCQVFEDSAYGIQAAEAAGMMATDVTPYLKPWNV